MLHLLIVEDEKNLNRIISKRLESAGYSIDKCFNGEEAIYYINNSDFDAVIMDIMMPKLSGIDVLKYMRKNNISTPVLLLTAKCSIPDIVNGLDSGAEDYIVKPFSFDELLARIRTITRKLSKNYFDIYTVADLEINITQHTVKRSGKEISLSLKEFKILEYLVINKGIALSRQKIESYAWNFDHCSNANVIDVYIRYIRKKIDDNHTKKLIHTIRGFGYVLKED